MSIQKQSIGSNHLIPFSSGSEYPTITIPKHACDCHHHIFDPVRFPYRPADTTHIPSATVTTYQRLQKKLGFTRNVVVTPSAYGTDNACTLDALKQLGKNARGVVSIDDSVSTDELATMHQQGVRGIRFFVAPSDDLNSELIRELAQKISPFGWHICLWLCADRIVEMETLLMNLPCDVVFDHRGHLPANVGMQHKAFQIICDLMKKGKGWVKLSAAYHDSNVGYPHFSDTVEIGKQYITTRQDRVLWGTDWPHPSETINQKEMPNDVLLLDLLKVQANSDAIVEQILVTNPNQLYGFDD